jgi:hypothetical protein
MEMLTEHIHTVRGNNDDKDLLSFRPPTLYDTLVLLFKIQIRKNLKYNFDPLKDTYLQSLEFAKQNSKHMQSNKKINQT